MNSKDINDPNKLYEYLKVDKDLVTSLSILFSRFEYALKRTKYCKRHSFENNTAMANWNEFAKEQNISFNSRTNLELKKAVKYLLEKPPQKQIVKDGKLDWEPVKNKDVFLEQILLFVRRVRNNLFHGGKFPSGTVDEPGRDAKLLGSCVIILKECISLDKEIKRWFWESD